ncbi:2-oxoglutarate and iron-dependent oxygenase domain-containing protein 2 isoform X2 [Narcine bancroftii]|uniref:2-oxoglutarate and iron-dependent oxygenase domain-containing protein 2 isoform X2 n=1 Tax=Narcine bancroftii TaxID=1343680 RepID=UPI00383131C1
MERGCTWSCRPVAGPRFYSCRCFYTGNIFLQRYRLHVDRDVAAPELGQILQSKGCKTEEQFKEVQAEIDQEVQRRKLLSQASLERVAIISAHYHPLNPAVYVLQENFLAPEFREIVAYCRSEDADFEGLLDQMKSQPAERVYSFPVFTWEFCSQLVAELENFEQSEMPKGRPNTMNNYGVLLNELGFDETLITPLREDYLQTITSILYPDYGGQSLDSHKAFVVKYADNQDRDLSFHYDNAEVTLNVSLGKDFDGGNLYFGDMRFRWVRASVWRSNTEWAMACSTVASTATGHCPSPRGNAGISSCGCARPKSATSCVRCVTGSHSWRKQLDLVMDLPPGLWRTSSNR